ncbi:MAG: hypothetical protein MOB07_16260 [Acidobacteria bacterium]|nr:hypothetical protein [Acidobacteriota bacterium]
MLFARAVLVFSGRHLRGQARGARFSEHHFSSHAKGEAQFRRHSTGSVAIGVQLPLLPSITMSPGHVSTGRSRSRIVTRKVHAAVLLLVSEALHVTQFVPTGIMDPLGGLQERVAPGQLSRTVAE